MLQQPLQKALEGEFIFAFLIQLDLGSKIYCLSLGSKTVKAKNDDIQLFLSHLFKKDEMASQMAEQG